MAQENANCHGSTLPLKHVNDIEMISPVISQLILHLFLLLYLCVLLVNTNKYVLLCQGMVLAYNNDGYQKTM